VDEAMTPGPLTTIAPDAPASRAAEIMQQQHVHRLPVVEDGKLIGIITTTDLVKAVADRKLSYRTFVFP
jgi:CBS domain-containing protein